MWSFGLFRQFFNSSFCSLVFVVFLSLFERIFNNNILHLIIKRRVQKRGDCGSRKASGNQTIRLKIRWILRESNPHLPCGVLRSIHLTMAPPRNWTQVNAIQILAEKFTKNKVHIYNSCLMRSRLVITPTTLPYLVTKVKLSPSIRNKWKTLLRGVVSGIWDGENSINTAMSD